MTPALVALTDALNRIQFSPRHRTEAVAVVLGRCIREDGFTLVPTKPLHVLLDSLPWWNSDQVSPMFIAAVDALNEAREVS